MKKTLIPVVLLFLALSVNAQDYGTDEAVVRSIADRIISSTQYGFTDFTGEKTWTTAKEIPENTRVRFKSEYLGWYYVNGVINLAMVDLGKYLNNDKYIDHCVNQVYFGLDNYKVFENRFKEGMRTRGYPYRQIFDIRELDDCGAMGASAIEAYNRKPTKELREYIDRVADHIMNKQDRLDDGTLVRKFPHEMTLWADDLYMSVPFLARMGNLTSDKKYYDDAVKQVLNFNKYLWDQDKGLYYHCWYSDLKRNGVAHWGRCNGWIMMANVQLLNFLPADYPGREEIIKNLEKQILGIAKYQDGKGLWHQLLDKNDSYEESSCTSMFTFCIAKAVNEGWIDRRYASIALAGWNGLKAAMITLDGQLRDVCVGTGIEDNLVFYYNRPARLNDSHGLGAVIEAGVEIMKLKNTLNSDR